MSGPLRNKQGCWTCRVRKKKCDEGRPSCEVCEALSIVCYGFGKRPKWMDGGEKEKVVANNIKEIVKFTSRRKGTRQLSTDKEETIRLSPKTLNGGGKGGSELTEASTEKLVGQGSLRKDDDRSISTAVSITADESVLLMHYLDVVFPLQFPAYKPSIQDGGRGWLLALLRREKAFYHAVLALNTYHRWEVTRAHISHEWKLASLVQQGQHLETCLGLVDGFAKNGCPKIRLGVTMAVVQLVFFELFTGLSNGWQAHLDAAMGMYRRGCDENLAHFGLSEAARGVLTEELAMPECDPGVAEEIICFRFLTSTLFWLDIISSVPAGTTPQLQPYQDSVLAEKSTTRLEEVMGCKNWVMVQVGRIAALHERRTRAVQKGGIEFEDNANDIARQVQLGLVKERMVSEDVAMLITCMFAHMALIFLHLVVRGFQELEVLDATISVAMEMLELVIPAHILPALICPLYVVGCVARAEEEPFFRSVFESKPMLDPGLKHRKRILPMLEEIWRRRRSTPGLRWADCVDVSCDVLLI